MSKLTNKAIRYSGRTDNSGLNVEKLRFKNFYVGYVMCITIDELCLISYFCLSHSWLQRTTNGFRDKGFARVISENAFLRLCLSQKRLLQSQIMPISKTPISENAYCQIKHILKFAILAIANMTS